MIYMVIGAFLLCLCLVFELYDLSERADESQNRADGLQKQADDLQMRLSRMQLAMGLKDTKQVPYEQGWSPRDSWEDDFNRTSYYPGRQSNLHVSVYVPWYVRLLTWLLRKVS